MGNALIERKYRAAAEETTAPTTTPLAFAFIAGSDPSALGFDKFVEGKYIPLVTQAPAVAPVQRRAFRSALRL